MPAFRRDDGSVTFVERGALSASFFLPCGQCIGCRLKRSREWAIRCVHEASLNDVNCFLTLTYDDSKVVMWSLFYDHFQDFIKRLRARFSNVRVRFYMCGEYGDEFKRPHYHALLFGFDFLDKVPLSKSPGGSQMYRSPVLEELWPYGFSSVGAVTFESAAYVARYCTKKITGSPSLSHYQIVDTETGEVRFDRAPEFSHMSLKPGIGADWLARYRTDVYPAGKVVRWGGASFNAPRYYDELIRRFDENTDSIDNDLAEYSRYLESLKGAAHQTPERLAVREKVAKAALGQLKRSIS